MLVEKPVWLRRYDYFCSALIGAVTAYLTALVVSVGWPMIAGMITGTFIGIVVITIAIMTLSLAGGTFELMPPAMLTGKITGMTIGMFASMAPLVLTGVILLGISIGLLAQGIVHYYDSIMYGEVK